MMGQGRGQDSANMLPLLSKFFNHTFPKRIKKMLVDARLAGSLSSSLPGLAAEDAALAATASLAALDGTQPLKTLLKSAAAESEAAGRGVALGQLAVAAEALGALCAVAAGQRWVLRLLSPAEGANALQGSQGGGGAGV